MTDKLNPEQRRRVAEAVSEHEYMLVENFIGEEVILYKPSHINGKRYKWDPGRFEDQWKALVQWLATNLPKHRNDEGWTYPFIAAIARDETETLEFMVHEILEASDTDNAPEYHPLDNVEDWSGMS